MSDHIAFIIPHFRDTRCHRRIRSLLAVGHKISVFAFTREYGGKSCLPEDVELIDLGSMRHGRYIRRVSSLFRAVHVLMKYRNVIHRSNILWYCSPDCALVGIVASFLCKMSLKKTVYDIADIQSPQFAKGIIGKLVRGFESWILGHTDSLVLTAPRFYTGYYANFGFPEDRVCIIENKPMRSDFPIYRR